MAVTTDIQNAVDMWIKNGASKVDVNQLDGEFLRKEIIRQVKQFSIDRNNE